MQKRQRILLKKNLAEQRPKKFSCKRKNTPFLWKKQIFILSAETHNHNHENNWRSFAAGFFVFQPSNGNQRNAKNVAIKTNLIFSTLYILFSPKTFKYLLKFPHLF